MTYEGMYLPDGQRRAFRREFSADDELLWESQRDEDAGDEFYERVVDEP